MSLRFRGVRKADGYLVNRLRNALPFVVRQYPSLSSAVKPGFLLIKPLLTSLYRQPVTVLIGISLISTSLAIVSMILVSLGEGIRLPMRVFYARIDPAATKQSAPPPIPLRKNAPIIIPLIASKPKRMVSARVVRHYLSAIAWAPESLY